MSAIAHRRRFSFNLSRCLPLLLASSLLVPAPGRAQSAPSAEALYQLFQVDLPAADVVMLLDASRSMREQYGSVRRSVVEFAPALTDKENLHLRVFGDTVSNPLEGKGAEVGRGVDGYLPPEPFFNHTDLGLAILKGLEFLERGDAGPVQAFFLLTDGLHQPPADSPFSRDFAADPDWLELRRRAEALCSNRTVFVYGFGLGQQTDIAVLRRIFPARNVEVIVGNSSQVAYALRRVRELLGRAQLRQAVERELGEGGVEARLRQSEVSGNVTEFDVPLTIRNAYRRLPVRIEQVKVRRERGSSSEIECALEGAPSGATLEAGKQWEGTIAGALRAEPPGWRVGESARKYGATFSFVPVVRFQHEAALDELGLDSTPVRVDVPSLAVDLRVSYGLPYWPFILLGLIGAAMAGVAVVRRKRMEEQIEAAKRRHAERRRLVGALKIWPARDEEPEGDGADLSYYGGARLDLALTMEGELEVIAPEQDADEASAIEQPSGERVAHLSGQLIGARPEDGESGKPEFHIEATAGHRLAYESGGEMREAARLTLCDGDVIEIDGRWRLRYTNHRLRTRAEVESSQSGDVFYAEQ